MSKFKEQINKDLDVFINRDEFADWHYLNDKKIKCIVDSNHINDAKYNRGSSFNDGLSECDVVISYKFDDYNKVFDTTYECYLDNIKYEVQNFKYIDGLAELRLIKV